MKKLKEMREAYADLRKQAYDACINLMKESGNTSVRFDWEEDDEVWCVICYGDGQLVDGRVAEVILDEEFGQPHLSFEAVDNYGNSCRNVEEDLGFYIDLYEALLDRLGYDE